MQIKLMTAEHATQVIDMMRVFYNSPAVLTNGSEEIFANNVNMCVSGGPYSEGYVFEADGKLVGYAMLSKGYNTEYGKMCVWIEDLYVMPDHRRRGYATAFIKLIDGKYGDRLLRLELESSNEIALSAYLKNGFDILPYLEMKKLPRDN